MNIVGQVYVNINERHLPENGRSSYKATMFKKKKKDAVMASIYESLGSCLATEHSMMKSSMLFDCGPLPLTFT